MLEHLPNQFKIDLEVAMRDAISHRVDYRPRHVGMAVGELWRGALDIFRRLADVLDVSENGILNQLVFEKTDLIDILRIAVDSSDSLENMTEIVRDTRIVFAHTGNASLSTRARNFSGKALGVSTSTPTPSKRSSVT